MVAGEFKCLGSVQHLKEKYTERLSRLRYSTKIMFLSRFGDGYTILIRTNVDVNRQTVIDYIQKSIQEAIVKEEHNKMIHFRVSPNVSLHRMFTVLETAREELINLIEDYTVTQVTLDDVFVNFAKAQQDNSDMAHKIDNEDLYELTCRKANRIGGFKLMFNQPRSLNYFFLSRTGLSTWNYMMPFNTHILVFLSYRKQ